VTLSIGIDELFLWIARLDGVCTYTVDEVMFMLLMVLLLLLVLCSWLVE
jgi:hypothetical protein